MAVDDCEDVLKRGIGHKKYLLLPMVPFEIWMETPEKREETAGIRVLELALRAAYAIGVLVYVGFYAEDFTLFQKLVVLLVAIVVYQAAKAIVRVARPGHRRFRYGWW